MHRGVSLHIVNWDLTTSGVHAGAPKYGCPWATRFGARALGEGHAGGEGVLIERPRLGVAWHGARPGSLPPVSDGLRVVRIGVPRSTACVKLLPGGAMSQTPRRARAMTRFRGRRGR